jgi:hypothetical protein
MKEIPRMGGDGDGPKVGTAMNFDFEGNEIILVAANKEVLLRFCNLVGHNVDNTYEAMLAEMEHVEVVSGPGVVGSVGHS